MQTIKNVSELNDLYESAVPNSVTKVAQRLTPKYREWIGAARFLVLTINSGVKVYHSGVGYEAGSTA